MSERNTYPTIREEMLNALYDKGWSSARGFLEAAHGGDLPKGFEWVNVPDFQINYKSTFSDPVYYLRAAVMSVRGNWAFAAGIGTFGSLKTAAYFLGAMAVAHLMSVKGYVKSMWDPQNVYINDIYAAMRYLDRAHEGTANTIAHEGWHSTQAHDGQVSLSSALDDNRNGIKTYFPQDMSKWLKYLTHEAELAARLFTVLSNAYVQHGTYPRNKYELWACLISQGMTPPQGVLKIMHDNYECPECVGAMREYPSVQHYIENYSDKDAVNNLNDVDEGMATEHQRLKIWASVYPWIYGDIIEVMGDRLGHARMGHTHNIQLREIFMKEASEHARTDKKKEDRPDETAAFERLKQIGALMRPEDATSLMELLLSGFPYKEASARSIRIAEGPTRLIAVFALANHPQITPHTAANVIYRATGLDAQDWKDRMMKRPASRMQEAIKHRRLFRARRGRPWDGPMQQQASDISFIL